MVSYESFYQGINYATHNPSFYTAPISGYTSPPVSDIGMALNPFTANQLGELRTKLNPGQKIVEVQGIKPEILESIPEQHLDEMRRIFKLTGVTPTLHGPLLDASGIGEGGFSEENRMGVEKQMESAVLRSHKLDPKGNISVTFHSTVSLPEMQPHIKKEGKKEPIEEGLWIIDESTGQIGQIKPEKRYFPEGKGEEFTGKGYQFQAEKELERRNRESWIQNLSQINQYADWGEDTLRKIGKDVPKELLADPERFFDKVKDEGDREKFRELYGDSQRATTQGQIYLRNSYRSMKDFFDKAWGNANETDKVMLREFANRAKEKITSDIDTDITKIDELRNVVSDGLNVLSNLSETPQIYKPLNDFAIEKSAQTFANVAESAYSKYGKTAPIVNIENPPAGTGLSTAEDMKKLVVDSRTQLTKNLIDKRGMSKSEANAVSEKRIGATWDVGHINMLRKKGYTEKDVIDQTKIIAPYVKHVHLSDNFGLDHTELPMGMGNVPLKEHKEILKKAGFKGAEIVEAGNWWQHFAEQGGGNPFLASIEAFDSPIYSMMEGPGWANTGFYGGYFSGHGAINPPIHHNTYGAGFHTLPAELGGEMPGDRGRFAGTPNA